MTSEILRIIYIDSGAAPRFGKWGGPKNSPPLLCQTPAKVGGPTKKYGGLIIKIIIVIIIYSLPSGRFRASTSSTFLCPQSSSHFHISITLSLVLFGFFLDYFLLI